MKWNMKFYTITNPLGSILFFVNAYSTKEEKEKKELILDWFNQQSPSFQKENRLAIYESFKDKFNLDLDVLNEIFVKLGWQTHYVISLIEENMILLFNTGLIEKTGNTVVLTGLGKHLYQQEQYQEYIKSIHFKANFWKLNNVIITDDEGIGSGCFIDKTTIATCRHVIEDLKQKIKIIDESGKEYTIKNVVYHPNDMYDLAKVTVNEEYTGFTYQFEDSVSIIQKAIVFGYPPIPLTSKPFLVANLGEISSIVDDYHSKAECLILSCITRPGNSGGSVINENGKLIGIMIQNRENKLSLTWKNSQSIDVNKSIAYATAIKSKYLLEF